MGNKIIPDDRRGRTIRELPEHQKPREKLLQRGVDSLTDAEILAILLRTGGAAVM